MSEINDQDQQTRAWLNQCDDPEHDTLATDNEITSEIIRAFVDGRNGPSCPTGAHIYALFRTADAALAGLVSHLPENDWDGVRRGPGGRPWDAATEAAYGDTETEGTTP